MEHGSEQFLIGVLVLSFSVLFTLICVDWRKKSAWIGLFLIAAPYAHIFIQSGGIPQILTRIYSFCAFAGLLVLMFNMSKKDKTSA